MSVLERAVFPTVSVAQVDRWDREWMHYFSTESRYQHLVEYRDLELIDDLGGKTAKSIFNTTMMRTIDGSEIVPLRIWIDGNHLVGKAVVEIGCGCGWLGKQLGAISTRYVGIDYSQFALAVARGTSPSNCQYIHVSRHDELAALEGSFDTMVGREFFIHQNFENSIVVLRMGAFFLKSGGIISADFYEPNPEIEQGVIHPAKSELDPQHASCGFRFNLDEIQELAELCGLTVVDHVDYLPHQRRFVTFEKP
ncbi:class I SAM-dependent methyltransferase [Paraburkholderia sp. GAS334]|uniref:class I SAM-dependent methyltransferase n=1 Tax=Paraburkholderia sp. GAS334 TaxID=3035131 RepID=UPI003D207814